MESPLRVRLLSLAAFAALCFAAAWPFRADLVLPPLLTDCSIWVTRTAMDQPDWLSWDLNSQHIIGYRPVQALSLSLDWALSGGSFDPIVYHLTDVVAHLACGALAWAAFARLRPGEALPGLATAAVMVIHPAGEAVVPYFQTRGYSLATAFTLGAMALVAGNPGESRLFSPKAVASCVAMLLATLSNEGALFASPVLGWLATDGEKDRWKAGVLPMLGAPLAFVIRTFVLPQTSHRPTNMSFPDTLAILASLLTLPSDPRWLGALGGAVLIGGLAFAARGDRNARPVLLWLALLFLLFVGFRIDKPRVVYLMVAPYALLIGLAFAEVRRRFSQADADARRFVEGGVVAAGLFVVLGASPLILGPDPVRRLQGERQLAAFADFDRAVAGLVGPADINLVALMPAADPEFKGRPRWRGLVTKRWAEHLVRGRGLRILNVLIVVPEGEPPPDARWDVDRVRFTAPALLVPSAPRAGSWTTDQAELTPSAHQDPEYVYFLPPFTGGLIRIDQ